MALCDSTSGLSYPGTDIGATYIRQLRASKSVPFFLHLPTWIRSLSPHFCHLTEVFLFLFFQGARDMSTYKYTGFKQCGECCKQMSVTDPHLVCLSVTDPHLVCLVSHHDSKICSDLTRAPEGYLGAGGKVVHRQALKGPTSLEVPGKISILFSKPFP